MYLPNSLTTLQKTKLSQAGIDTTYKLITYLPTKFSSIVKLSEFLNYQQRQDKIEYSALVTVVDYSIMGGGRGVKISLDTEELGRIICYTFLPVRFIIGKLQIQSKQFCILKKSGDFWNLESFVTTDLLEGRETKLVTQYAKISGLTSVFFRGVFKRLKPEEWYLNLVGLVPSSLSIPELLSLRGVHLPNSSNEYTTSLQQYQLFKAFLDLCTTRWFNESQKQLRGPASHIDKKIINKVIQAHPYQLSPTQDYLVHYYLQKLASVDKS
jgi:RecG-like helicase